MSDRKQRTVQSCGYMGARILCVLMALYGSFACSSSGGGGGAGPTAPQSASMQGTWSGSFTFTIVSGENLCNGPSPGGCGNRFRRDHDDQPTGVVGPDHPRRWRGSVLPGRQHFGQQLHCVLGQRRRARTRRVRRWLTARRRHHRSGGQWCRLGKSDDGHLRRPVRCLRRWWESRRYPLHGVRVQRNSIGRTPPASPGSGPAARLSEGRGLRDRGGSPLWPVPARLAFELPAACP